MSPKKKPALLYIDPDSSPLKLEPLSFGDSPVTVRVLPEDIQKKPLRKRLFKWITLYSFVLFILAVWLIYFKSTISKPVEIFKMNSGKTVGIGYIAPEFIVLRNKNTIEVTVKNTEIEPFSGTVSLVFSSSAAFSVSGKGKASFQLKELLPDVQMTLHADFVLYEEPVSDLLSFEVMIQESGTSDECVKIAPQQLKIAPASWSHKFIISTASLWIILLLPVIIGIVAERFKVWFG